MANNNMNNEKKIALLAYKEKLLEEIKYYEKSIEDFRANHKKNSFYDDHDSSDSEDDFPTAIDTGPTIPQLKLQQSMMKTCLQATQELTSLVVLQSEVNVLVEDPTFEGEKPVTEEGIWREVTAECRIDLVPFTISFYMHTPHRKFGPPSYRGLRVVPVKYPHEMELAKSVLHTLKLPSDAVEVLRNYAVGYRSRRTTLARLANKYANALFMEPHAEGGFVLKCADLLEVSWRLENKWSPVAPFHHRMKFDLEYMDEAYIKIITQAHKQLLDPSIATDERTLLLAKIITTCLEVRGPIDPESDLESKTTERDTDIDKRDRDSEVMAPPKSLPKKVKQKNKDSVNNVGQKRSLDDENDDKRAKKIKSNVFDDESKKNDDKTANNARKSKLNEPVAEGSKKRKINEGSDKVAGGKNVKKSGNIEDGNAKSKNDTETANSKAKNVRESNIKETKTKSKNKVTNNDEDNTTKDINSKQTKNTKESKSEVNKNKAKNDDDTKTKEINTKNTKNTKESVNTEIKTNTKTKNGEGDAPIKDTNSKSKNNKEIEKNAPNTNTKESDKNINNKTKNNIGDSEAKDGNKVTNTKTKNKIIKELTKSISNTKNKPTDNASNINKENNTNNIEETNLDRNAKTKSKIPKEQDKNTNAIKNVNSKPKSMTSKDSGNQQDKKQNENAKTKNVESKKLKPISKENLDANKISINNEIQNKPTEKTTKVTNAKNSEATANKPKMKPKSVATTNTDEPTNKIPKIANKGTEKLSKVKTVNSNETQTIKKVTEKNAMNNKNIDRISPIVSDKNVKDKPTTKDTPPEKVLTKNVVIKKTKNIINKEIIKQPIKTVKNLTHKLASHRTALKVQNPLKINAGNTKMFKAGNTEKENGGKGTKIPMKKLSPVSEGSSKKNLLRISPRKLPSNLKASSQETFKQKMVKSTNIPRLMKNPVLKTTSIVTTK